LNEHGIKRIVEMMRRTLNIGAACIAIVAIMYLFVLPMVNPPLSTGAQWASAHLMVPTFSVATVDDSQRTPARSVVHEAGDALLDIIDFDSVRRC
jgi:hypothetical protein